MGNIKNFNFNKLDLKLSNSDYWDFFLATDEYGSEVCSGVTSGDCFVVWYDFNNTNIYSGGSETIYSLVSWDNAVNTGYTLNTIGLTGIDNGLVTFDKQSGDTSNVALLSALTGTTNSSHTHSVPALTVPALSTTLPSSVVNFIIKI